MSGNMARRVARRAPRALPRRCRSARSADSSRDVMSQDGRHSDRVPPCPPRALASNRIRLCNNNNLFRMQPSERKPTENRLKFNAASMPAIRVHVNCYSITDAVYFH